MQITPT